MMKTVINSQACLKVNELFSCVQSRGTCNIGAQLFVKGTLALYDSLCAISTAVKPLFNSTPVFKLITVAKISYFTVRQIGTPPPRHLELRYSVVP